MKKLLLVLLVLSWPAALPAQQALFGGNDIVSPEIHADNSVTFRLAAPEASKVEVTGDFLPVPANAGPFAQGTAALVKNEKGVWEYKSAPLTPELYSYTFIIDGAKVTDPNNVYSIRDVASVTSVFIIGGGYADLYRVNDVPHGTVARRWYKSPVLGKERRLTIYTPPGYEASKEKYPVLYLLHGAGGDEEAWIALGRTAQIMDNLIARGQAKPMLVVMTNGNANQQAAPGESALGFYKPSMGMGGIGGMGGMAKPAPGKPGAGGASLAGGFERHFPDVVRFIDDNYRTIAQKSGRAIAGLSMGGGHSLQISKEYPDMFDYVGLFSSAVSNRNDRTNDAQQPEIYRDFAGKLKIQFEKKPKLYWIAIGKTDFLYQANVDFRKMLDTNGYPYTYVESDGGHIWKNWRLYLTQFARLLF